jgi:hypothetical protein
MDQLIPRSFGYVILLIILNCTSLAAQTEKASTKDSLLRNSKDIVDILERGFKVFSKKDTLKGKVTFISILPVVGYSLQSGLTGAIITNTSFYVDGNKNRLSNLLVNSYYSQYHQYWFTANSNIFFQKYKIHLVGDSRYYNFPTRTFGLGNVSSLDDGINIKYSYLRISQIIFWELSPNMFAGGGYNLDSHWDVGYDTIPGKALEDLKRLGQGARSVSSGISINLLYDSRRNSVNPQGGNYANLQYRPNLKLLGSNSDWQSLLIDLRHYTKFPASSGNILSFWNYYNFTLQGTPPYLDTPSIGWDSFSNTGRGYVPGRYTDRNLIYLESEYRFGITRDGLLGGVVFGNMENLFEKWSDKQRLIPGYGLGIRIKMNKHSGTNLSIDYGFGEGGSHGLFFNLGEVF